MKARARRIAIIVTSVPGSDEFHLFGGGHEALDGAGPGDLEGVRASVVRSPGDLLLHRGDHRRPTMAVDSRIERGIGRPCETARKNLKKPHWWGEFEKAINHQGHEGTRRKPLEMTDFVILRVRGL